MPPTHPSQADVAAAYRTLIAHETEPKEQDFYRTRLQQLEQATEPECEFDCRIRVAAAGVGVYCPQCSAKSADTDLTTQLAIQQIEGEAAWWRSIGFDRNASRTFESMTGDSQQAVRTGVERVLAHLASTGRLIPAGGMALTAKQVEDVKIVLGQLERGGPAFEAAHERLRALFPATEPAEDAPCAICNVNETNHAGVSYYHPFTTEPGPFDDEGNDRSAPAEPTEEETKAEDIEVTPEMLEACANLVFDTDVDASVAHALQGMAKELRHYNAELAAEPTSSPVVPAPTETGPWPTLDVIPVDVRKVRDGLGELWKRDDLGRWLAYTADQRAYVMVALPVSSFDEFAPFVAAEEG